MKDQKVEGQMAEESPVFQEESAANKTLTHRSEAEHGRSDTYHKQISNDDQRAMWDQDPLEPPTLKQALEFSIAENQILKERVNHLQAKLASSILNCQELQRFYTHKICELKQLLEQGKSQRSKSL